MEQEQFDQSINRWSQKPREQKAEYYDAAIWPEVERRFIERHPGKREYDVLIIPVSNPHTAILHLDCYAPAVAVFVYSALARSENRERLRAAAAQRGITYEEYEQDIIVNDPTSVYQAVKQIYVRHTGRRIAVDVTGGTKAMSVGVAMAGSLIGADSIYIESRFDAGIQDRLPGSERPGKLPDPYTVFGDLAAREAKDRYDNLDFVGAREIFRTLAQRLSAAQQRVASEDEPQPHVASRALGAIYQTYADLSNVYAAWDILDLREAPATMARLVAALERGELPILQGESARLRFQASVLARLTAAQAQFSKAPFDILAHDLDTVLTFLGSLYANAMRRERQERFDFAALLLYRCLELMSQRRLATHGIDADALRIDLTKGYRMLNSQYADPLICQPRATAGPGPSLLDRIHATNKARNKSILAHGFALISRDEVYMPFREVVEAVLDRFYAAEQLEQHTGLGRAAWLTLFDAAKLE